MLKPRPLSICLQNQPAMAGKAETLPDISAERRVGTDNVLTRRDPQPGNDSNLLIVFYVQIMPDDFVMQLHRF